MGRGFLSDNASGIHPKVLEAMARANVGHADAAYGEDAYSKDVARRLAERVGGVEAFFVFNGTGANVLALSALLRPYEAVLCAEGAHVQVDEAGALERFSGSRVVPCPTRDGKLRPADLAPHLRRLGDQHAVQPRVVTLTNATEVGTVYSAAEVRALTDSCRAHGLRVHVDGARLANAAAAHGGDARALCAGIDALSFGGTKDGALAAEAVVLFDERDARAFRHVRKQGMQLASKARFVAAQFDALLTDDLWLANAAHANAMAAALAAALGKVPGVALSRRPEANAVFARMPQAMADAARRRWPFYVWDAHGGAPGEVEVRLVCSFDTTPEDVAGVARALAEGAA